MQLIFQSTRYANNQLLAFLYQLIQAWTKTSFMLDLLAHRRSQNRAKRGGKAIEEASFSFDLNCVETLLLPISFAASWSERSVCSMFHKSRQSWCNELKLHFKTGSRLISANYDLLQKSNWILLQIFLINFHYFSTTCCNWKNCVSLTAFSRNNFIRLQLDLSIICWTRWERCVEWNQ